MRVCARVVLYLSDSEHHVYSSGDVSGNFVESALSQGQLEMDAGYLLVRKANI